MNLKYTFNVNFCLKTIVNRYAEKKNRKSSDRRIDLPQLRIEIRITKDEIRIEATQLTRKIVTALMMSILS